MPSTLLTSIFANFSLALRLARRELETRFRGSFLGVLWLVLTPLLMLAMFTLVFSGIFASRWQGVDDPKSFALVLFVGLILFQFFAELLTRAPGLFLEDRNYIKRLVFPVEILPVVAMLTAATTALISFALLVLYYFAVLGMPPAKALLTPVILAPFAILTLGLTYTIASIGMFLRDFRQIFPWVTQALMFLGPIFYPVSALPELLRPYIYLNPLTFIIEEIREVWFFGASVDWFGVWVYSIVASLLLMAGLSIFRTLRPAFADVV